MNNRNGDLVSAQISVAGVIDIANSENFKKEDPFCVKNDGDTAVFLEVRLFGMPEGEFVRTRFETGWNPEIVSEIKAASITNPLIWGY